ncbi:DUF3564 domain-containing protein [Burkholderia pseudomallei]|uniref:DUF3564 family protein n=9 Tax=pseudomallei group TaxID=111527 RepID=Q63MH5_BURPS|nr:MULTISPECIES: DUF3564 domain-containing protein [Burkholderia]EIF59679.1 hypothetical protein BP1258A_3520 [Burkholderia pseudomallei 1258a]KGW44571.1 hypothetical protein Y049_5138 [Burkholderia pseudomallei MSHR684]KGX79479.1 hypothetical protein Y033_5942 [Burkholderia pseudomallei MSHR435]AAY59252.1 hypothetical protein BMAA1150 [Burkholderia mallei ATCC 23344]ABA53040.1 hypothetical protein BURPS1710b_A2253 [Burkholderia pseudomallei 1710b]
MRLTIRINGSDAPAQQFAVLWLDTDEQLWSREAHQGIDLPAWGKVKDVEGAVALCSADSGEALCRLQGLSFSNVRRLSEDEEHGNAVLGGKNPQGAWRLQAVDSASIQPEHREFTIVR